MGSGSALPDVEQIPECCISIEVIAVQTLASEEPQSLVQFHSCFVSDLGFKSNLNWN